MLDGNVKEEESEGFRFPFAEEPIRPGRWASRLGSIVYFGIMFGLVLVLARAAWMQVIEKKIWAERQALAQTRTTLGPEQRGNIYDRHHRLMAVDKIIPQIAIDPDQLSRRFRLAKDSALPPLPVSKWSVSKILDRLAEEEVIFLNSKDEMQQQLISDIRSNLQFHAGDESATRVRYRLLGTIPNVESRNQISKFISEIESEEELDLKIFPPMGQRLQRFHPYGAIGSLLIGEMDKANSAGLWGMEKYWDENLKKVQSVRRYRATPKGSRLGPSREGIPGKQGQSVQTTIDLQLQAELEHLVRANYYRTSAKSVSAAVIDPFTGEIHAWTTYPGLQRGQLTEFANQDFKNDNNEGMKRAFELNSRLQTVSMEPGSVVKPLILSRAIEMGIPLDLPLDVRGKSQRLDGRKRIFRDSSLLREKTPEGAVVFSSNIGMVVLGVKHMRSGDVESILKRFGFGRRTGIELPGEESGLLKDIDEWSRFTWESACFGYEMMVTPVQVMRAYMAIANGGYLLQPTFMMDSENRPVEIILSADVARESRRVLARVVKDGTGRHVIHHVGPRMKELIRSGELQMAGKTGTTKLVSANGAGFSEDRYNSSFVGFAPVEDARFLTMVLVEEPTPEENMYYASKSAAPLGAQILASALNLRGFDPFSLHVGNPGDYGIDNLAAPSEAGNLSSPGSRGKLPSAQGRSTSGQGQEGEPDRW